MHVFLNNGIANVEIARLWRALKARRVKLETLQDYTMLWILPQRHGKVQRAWLGQNRFGKECECLSSFSGILLSLIPII
eukprot:9502386-Pyramimonas_sp.AAC.1